MTKPISIARKTLRELFRNRRTLLLTLGFPVAFMLIFGFAFRDAGTTTYHVVAVNDDTGAMGATYLGGMSNLTYDGGKAMLAVTTLRDLAAAQTELKEKRADVLVRIPANFTAGLTAPQQQPTNPTLPVGQTGQPPRQPPAGSSVDVQIDPGSGSSQAAMQIVNSYTGAFAAKAAQQAPLVVPHVETITSASLSTFDFIAPGLFVYAMLNMAPQAAAVLAQESERRTLERLKLSRMSTVDLLGGVAIAQLVMALLALGLMFLTASLMGFHPQGSIPLAIVLGIVASAASIGIGMIIAAFAKTRDDAANIAVFVVVPASFLSGSFFPIPAVNLFTVAGHVIGAYDILPSTHAVRALRAILTLGQSGSYVSDEMYALVGLSALFFAVGAALFARRRMRLA